MCCCSVWNMLFITSVNLINLPTWKMQAEHCIDGYQSVIIFYHVNWTTRTDLTLALINNYSISAFRCVRHTCDNSAQKPLNISSEYLHFKAETDVCTSIYCLNWIWFLLCVFWVLFIELCFLALGRCVWDKIVIKIIINR